MKTIAIENAIIRMPAETDLNSLIQLMTDHAAYEKVCFSSKGKIEQWKTDLIGTNRKINCYVIEEELCLIGYFTYSYEYSTWDAGYLLYLDCLFLVEEARGKGIGSQIIEFLVQKAEEEKCVGLRWHTPEFNERGINFYLKCGAKPTVPLIRFSL